MDHSQYNKELDEVMGRPGLKRLLGYCMEEKVIDGAKHLGIGINSKVNLADERFAENC